MPARARAGEAVSVTAGVSVFYLVAVGLFVWLADMGWGDAAWTWVGLVVATFLWRFAATGVPEPVVAGSDWLGVGSGRGFRAVPLYELTVVDAGPDHDLDGPPIEGTTALRLRTANPREAVVVDLAMMETNPALWDLVYQGIRASVDAGAELTAEARAVLRLR